ncbi:mid region of cactin-domain-containing protein [Flagelloscypha sp. PMI_526]|nr:mid region of cactin-domain-containing protein [Flagelloscypha sp. PMI_526]
MGHRHRERSRSPSRRERDNDTHNRGKDIDRISKKRGRSISPDHKEKKRKRDKSEERQARKAEKRRLKDEQARNIAELSVYSGADNPFHDVNLTQQFRWHKKAEKERKSGINPAEAQRRDALRRQEAAEELERLNKRRADREVEARLREEEEHRTRRMQDSAQIAEWLAQEDDFSLEQERVRAAIRVKEKRAKAIDFLCLNLKYVNPPDPNEDAEVEDAALEIDLDEPYTIFDNLTPAQVEELHDDIEKYIRLEKSQVNIDFWTNMMVVCEDRLERLRVDERLGVEASRAVEADIANLLSGKSYDQLMSLQRQVQDKLVSGEPVDTDYWEGLLKQLVVWKAKSKLKTLHEVVVRNRLEELRKRQRDDALHAQQELLGGAKASNNEGSSLKATEATPTAEPYHRSMSPPLIDITKLPLDERNVDIVTAKDQLRSLLSQRRAVVSARFVAKPSRGPEPSVEQAAAAQNADMVADALFRAEAEKDLDEEEELFNLEEAISRPTSYQWEDKYRPRKPRYFNRVHTGYEWNKYNQTHYDLDNPPPKVVQGYKFNIFYPDLIDKSKAPTYKIIEEHGNDDTCLLLFTAGPPYEDIAFRIVRRDWEYSHKRGFKCSYDRGCLSLWFQFRRNFYRK